LFIEHLPVLPSSSRCLYVGYLPSTMTEEELGKLLHGFCDESPEDVRIIKDKWVVVLTEL